MSETEHADDDFEPSKSERKRQMHALQVLGEKLTTLNRQQLDQSPLSASLRTAIDQTATIKKHEAKRRHLQFIGKLMRKEDETSVEQISAYLEQLNTARRTAAGEHHEVEQWRDKIIGDEQQIEAFMQAYPQADRQWLRQTRRQQQREVQQQKPPAAARKLFQYLREVIQA